MTKSNLFFIIVFRVESSDKMKKEKKVKEKVKAKLWEKIFVIESIVIIFAIIGIYAYRTIHYYRKMNYIEPDSKLIDVITNQMNVVYSGDGLYKNDDNYYYKGIDVNNYLMYSGRLWRIIGVDSQGIKIITEDNQTSIVWGNNTNYEKSNIMKWLNQDVFIKSILDENTIADSKWCNSSVDINKYECTELFDSKIGLLTTNEYLLAGGVKSYLNNKTYFWTLNTSSDNKAYYIHNEGGINNDVGNNGLLYSYGVRPVVYLKADMSYISGDGTIDKPYITSNNNQINIHNHSVGTYVMYRGYKFRIMGVFDNYTKLIMDGYIMDDKNEPVKVTYNKINEYLNNTFLNSFNKDELVKADFIKTEYNNDTGYNYMNKKGNENSYVGIPVVGDLFVSEYAGNWLNSYYNNSQNLIFTAGDKGSLLADLGTSSNYIRPVIAVNNDLIITSGNGTKDDPFVVGDSE